MSRRLPITACSLLAFALFASAAAAAITAPSGVRVTTVARGLGQPANITFDPAGGLWTTSTSYGNRPTDGLWYTRRPGTRPVHVVRGVWTALGLTWLGGELFVSHVEPYSDSARSHRGVVEAFAGFDGRRFQRRRVVLRGLPSGLHNPDSLVAGPGTRLYLGLGSTYDDRRSPARLAGTVISFEPSGRDVRVEGRDFRNPFGLAFVADTSDLLVTDNGRDELGLFKPPDELNLIATTGPAKRFGFPECSGHQGRCSASESPLLELAPHASSDGLAVTRRFGRTGGLTAFIAENGSSFPRNPTGSDVIRVTLERTSGGYRARGRVFARGFIRHDPVGAAIGPGGALYVTLLKSGKVVRFSPPR